MRLNTDDEVLLFEVSVELEGVNLDGFGGDERETSAPLIRFSVDQRDLVIIHDVNQNAIAEIHCGAIDLLANKLRKAFECEDRNRLRFWCCGGCDFVKNLRAEFTIAKHREPFGLIERQKIFQSCLDHRVVLPFKTNRRACRCRLVALL